VTRHQHYIKECVVCGKSFEATRKDAKTDSGACRSKLDYWRHDNRKAAQAAIRSLFTLRCAVERGYDPAAINLIAQIEAAVRDELSTLVSKGIPLPQMLPTLGGDIPDCENDTHRKVKLA
jgi:predicted nucleic acid-binding Zn ribbon protein